jgi:hypothetical protein
MPIRCNLYILSSHERQKEMCCIVALDLYEKICETHESGGHDVLHVSLHFGFSIFPYTIMDHSKAHQPQAWERLEYSSSSK